MRLNAPQTLPQSHGVAECAYYKPCYHRFSGKFSNYNGTARLADQPAFLKFTYGSGVTLFQDPLCLGDAEEQYV